MDEIANQVARELADAIARAVAADPHVDACRARARAQGYELHLSLEATIGFAERMPSGAAPRQPVAVQPPAFELTANDRRFLRSLRIAQDEAREEV